MIKYESDCCDCGLPCRGSACPYWSVPHYYCDKCGDETDLYELDGNELCGSCVLDSLSMVKV